ncbi:hypothetical protein [Streptomyces sp. NPDC059994]|uniref:hypothetical protein n=1 Tax=Streptomyces sp. NPDC059994 TaxID=3347029 RepID=UPI003692A9EC
MSGKALAKDLFVETGQGVGWVRGEDSLRSAKALLLAAEVTVQWNAEVAGDYSVRQRRVGDVAFVSQAPCVFEDGERNGGGGDGEALDVGLAFLVRPVARGRETLARSLWPSLEPWRRIEEEAVRGDKIGEAPVSPGVIADTQLAIPVKPLGELF